jgi:hypothetical protein
MIVFDKLETLEHAVFVEMASRDAVIVSWWIRPTNEDLDQAIVTLFRSYSPRGPFESVAEMPGTKQYFRDSGALISDKWREIYYKLRVSSPDGSVDETDAFGVTSQPTLETIATRRRTDIALRYEGVPCLIYVRRGEGTRCPDCWDPVLQKVCSSTCTRCFNTGRLGGFYLPILTQVKINPVTKANEPGETLRQVSQTTGMCSFIPIVSPRDIIYEVNTGKRWRLVTVTPTEHHRVTIHQDINTMIELNPGDVENHLPIPSDLTPIIEEWRDERRYPQRPVVRDHDTTPEEELEGKAPDDVDFIVVDA